LKKFEKTTPLQLLLENSSEYKMKTSRKYDVALTKQDFMIKKDKKINEARK
jgi:hypothetical protein